MLYKLALTFDSFDKILSVTIQMKATEQYFPVVLFMKLYDLDLTFKSMDCDSKCHHLHKRYKKVLSTVLLFCGSVCCAVQGESDFEVWDDHSYSAIVSCGTVYYAEQGNSNV